MTTTQAASSDVLAKLLSEATGLAWETDHAHVNGEGVRVLGVGDWRRMPHVERGRFGRVNLNPHHPDQTQRRHVGYFKGPGWQAKVAQAVAKMLGEVKV